MKWILMFWGGIAGFYGLFCMMASRSAVHEIEAGLGFLIGTVAIGCAGIIEAVERKAAEHGEQRRTAPARSSLSVPFYK
jgi:hypothetical protein